MEKPVIFAVGTYTEKVPHAPEACGEGIHIISLNEESGRIAKVSTLQGMKNPSYLCWQNNEGILLATTESEEGSGEIQSFTVNPDKKLLPLSKQAGPGRAACHLVAIEGKKHIFATSYVDGCLKGYVMNKGELGPSFFYFLYEGQGPNQSRQKTSHAHQVLSGPADRFLYICDLGSDRIWKHDQNLETLPCDVALDIPAGYGPRHLAFDKTGEYVFILCELCPRLIVASIDSTDGKFTIVQDLLTVDPKSEKRAAPAAIKVHPSGNSVAVSNRFDDTISVFTIRKSWQPPGISLSLVKNFSSKGKTPRDICFSPDGNWLLIANQDSSNIQLRAFDSYSGLPGEGWGRPFKLGTPVCVVDVN